MERVFVYKNARIKVTYNEPINMDYEVKVASVECQCETKELSGEYSVSVELEKPTGGKVCYGMLAATVKPSVKGERVMIDIVYTKKNTVRFKESMLLDDGYVYKGLPLEYLDGIIERANNVVTAKEAFPRCDICFDGAANCEVGSSPVIFSYITEIILDIIYNDSIEEIFSMGVQEFTGKYVNCADLLHLKLN